MTPKGFRNYLLSKVGRFNDRAMLLMTFTLVAMIQMIIADKAVSETVRQQLGSIAYGMSVWEIWIYALLGYAVLPFVFPLIRLAYGYYRNGKQVWTDDYWSEYA